MAEIDKLYPEYQFTMAYKVMAPNYIENCFCNIMVCVPYTSKFYEKILGEIRR